MSEKQLDDAKEKTNLNATVNANVNANLNANLNANVNARSANGNANRNASTFPVFDPATPKVSTLSVGMGVLESAIELVVEARQQAAKFQPQASNKADFMLKAYSAVASTKCILTNATGVRLQFFEPDSIGILPEYKPPKVQEPGEVASFLVDKSFEFELKYNIQTFQGPMAGWVSGDADKFVAVKGVAGNQSEIDAVVQVDLKTMYQTQFTFDVSFNDNLWHITVKQSITGITGYYYVPRHINTGNVQGDIYASEAEAFARFAELDGGLKAATVLGSKTAAATSPATDEQLTELKFYGDGRGTEKEMKEWARERLNIAKYYVTRHINYGDVQGDIYASEAEAFARFAELDGGLKAAAVWDQQLTKLTYYYKVSEKVRGLLLEEMKEWVRERPDPTRAA